MHEIKKVIQSTAYRISLRWQGCLIIIIGLGKHPEIYEKHTLKRAKTKRIADTFIIITLPLDTFWGSGSLTGVHEPPEGCVSPSQWVRETFLKVKTRVRFVEIKSDCDKIINILY